VSPSARSAKRLRSFGFIVAFVEKIIHMPGAPFPKKKDAFGFGDLLISRPDWGVGLVQVTSRSNLNAREKKSRAIPELKVWLESGGRFILQGWKKDKKSNFWQMTEREIML
jgi:hypothetical protein